MSDASTIPAILTRELSGSYALTSRPMVVARVEGAMIYDAYVEAGDALAIRHLCPRRVAALFGVDLRRLESIAVEITGRVVEGASPVHVRRIDQVGE